MEYTHGQMIESIEDGGRKESKMGWEFMLCMKNQMSKNLNKNLLLQRNFYKRHRERLKEDIENQVGLR